MVALHVQFATTLLRAPLTTTALLVSLWFGGGFALIAGETAPPVAQLPVVQGDYPRVFFFRQSEGVVRRGGTSFNRWEESFSRLMGIEGKVLDEELPNTLPHNLEFFTQFKLRHPDQLVMLHFNGNARDPRFDTEQFHPGHWLYHVGSKVLSDIAAEEGTTEIMVEDPTCFCTQIGRYRDRNDDLGLCELDESGRPNWGQSEQVQLLAVNRQKKTILVKRGCYGTRPRRFLAGRAYAAAHASEGPWGRNSNLLWYYNYATCCPRDNQGRTCADILVEEFGRWFALGGELSHFDGVEFDVLAHRAAAGGRPVDCDADGKPDGGIVDGVNAYGIGVIRFLEALRARLGEGKLILADGQQDARGQRGFGIINGIESEGFPTLRDWAMHQWSTAINRHNFWTQFSRPPVFSYINHKYVEPGTEPGVQATPKVPFSTHRLVFAAAVMTDAAICYSFAPPNDRDFLIGVWDEFWAGTDRRLGWLGQPLGPTETLATRTPDLLATTIAKWKQNVPGVEVSGVKILWKDGQFSLEPDRQDECDLTFAIPVELPSREAYVEFVASADPLPGYPEHMARYATCTLVPQGWMMDASRATDVWLGQRKPSAAAVIAEQGTWLGRKPFTAGFFFKDLTPGTYYLRFRVEGNTPIHVQKVTLHAAPDARYRVFEHGAVLANPSLHEVTFDLNAIVPGRKLRRLKGSPNQDPLTNNGAAVGTTVVLPPKDALFLIDE